MEIIHWSFALIWLYIAAERVAHSNPDLRYSNIFEVVPYDLELIRSYAAAEKTQ